MNPSAMIRAIQVSIAFSVFVLALFSAGVNGQSTTFSYQGRLVQNSLPAAGDFDFTFALYDAESGGVPIDTQTVTSVPVATGIFSVELDFGAAFAGPPRWLEISVKPSGDPDPPTVLTPRRPINSAPYAIKSLNAESAETAADADNLGGVAASQFVITTDPRMTDARPPTPGSADYIQNTTSEQALSNFNVSGTGKAGSFNATTDFKLAGSRVISNQGAFNMFVGSAVAPFSTGDRNAFFGALAGNANSSGRYNTFLGHFAGFNNTSGEENLFVGAAAGDSNITGSSNTILGNIADVGSGDLTFATAIGAEATVSTSNTIALGRADGSDQIVIPGNMSVGGTLAASGSGLTDLNASNFSSGTLADARLSGNVALLNTAQTFIGSKTFGNASFFPAPPSFTAGGSPFFVSSTTKVTSLNADLLDGLNSTAFLQSVPVPLTMSGNSATHIIRAENISTTGNTLGGIFENRSTGGSGVYGLVTATTGTTNGVVGQSHSISGRGVYGGALATTGANYGVFGRSLSTSGRGVYGLASASTGLAYGVYGESQSTSGRGVYGLAIETTGITYGVAGESQSTSGYGVYGLAAATSGTGFGVYGNSRGTSGRGVFGRAEATTGSAYGVYGLTFSTSGRGVYGRASASSGLTYGVSGHIVSTSGAGVEGFAAATSGSTYGVWGLNHSTSGSGVYGLADASTGTTYGVRSEVNSPDGYAGYFTGGRNYFQNNVGIGTTTPTELLHVNGRIRVATLGSANTTTVLCRNTAQQIATCNSSSRRYKFNIDDLGSGLDLVRRLRPVAYNWIAGGARDVGLVAEEVAEAEPLLATYNDNGEVEGVKYDRVAVVLINAVREQQSMIDAQRKTIADQQAEIDTLKQRTDAMQKALCALTNEAALCEGVN